MVMDPGESELAAIRSRFCLVVARWRLSQAELRSILGESAGPVEQGRVLPNVLDSNAEQRMRLLVRLDSALHGRSTVDDFAIRLRETGSLMDGPTPLEMLADLADLRLAVALAEIDQNCDLPHVFLGMMQSRDE